MTNAEKYKDELIDSYIMEGFCGLKNVYDLKTDNTEFFCNNDCITCRNIISDWLLEEAPVDWSKVEPGTKCLVRDYDHTSWHEREFGVFAFGKPWFFAAGSLDSINIDTSLCNYTYYKLKDDKDEN